VELIPGKSPVELVDRSEIPVQVEIDKRDLAFIQMGQVDPGAENATSRVFRVIDHAAPEHTDLDP
jgi:hypothetical protein